MLFRSVATSEIVNRNSEFITMNVQATAGSATHFQMFEDDLLDLGSGSGLTDIQAYQGGNEQYAQPVRSWGSAIIMQILYQHMIVRADSGINSVYDLAGKTVGVGAAGSGGAIRAQAMFTSLGIHDQINYVYMSTGEIAEMFKDDQLDCIISSNPIGNANTTDTLNSVDCKFVPLSEEDFKKIAIDGELKGKTSEAFLTNKQWSIIPEGESVRTLTDYSSCNASLYVSDEVIYDLCKLYWDHFDEIKAVVSGNDAVPENILMATGLVHPGAAKYYKEEWGIDIPAEKISVR